MKSKIVALLLISQVTYASQPFVVENVVTEKGYILSVDLFNKKCHNIWTQRIPEFKKNNPKVKNPNILSIHQKIKVQNCQIVNNELPQPKVETPKVESVALETVKNRDYFAILSKEFNSINEDGSDGAKNGDGLKLEFGKYFHTESDRLIKFSLGLLRNNTKSKDYKIGYLESKRTFLTMNASYLFKPMEKFKLGPDLGLLYNAVDSTFKDYQNKNGQTVSGFIGVDAGYDVSDIFAIDLKVNKSTDTRLNLIETIGLEFKF